MFGLVYQAYKLSSSLLFALASKTFDNEVRMALSHVVLNGESFRKAECLPSMFIIDKLQGNRFQFSFYLRLLEMKK